MPDYNFYLAGDPNEVLIRCAELSHPAWLKTWRIVQNHADGLTVTHEDGTIHDYEYVPLAIEYGTNSDDLDQEITIGVGDLGVDFPLEIDRIRRSPVYAQDRPTLNYREFRLSDLSKPVVTINNLKAEDSEELEEGVVFVFRAERMNLTKTGDVYTLDNTPTLRGFV